MKKVALDARVVTAAVLWITLALGLVLAGLAHYRLVSLEATMGRQADQIESMSTKISAVQSGNGTSLDKCLDMAAKEYNSSVKSTGTVQEYDGKTVYVNDYAAWQEINAKLEQARKKCNEQYK